jgi:Carboxypeptidase regulatory-like domain/TonB dependent receptor
MRLAIVSSLLFSISLCGQVSTGSLSGYILDPSERSVSGATVTLQLVGRAVQRTRQTDSAGFYRFEELAPGDYQVVVNATGFASLRTEGVRVEVDGRARLDVRVPVAGKSEKVVVQGRTLELETESSELGAVLDQSRIELLPLNQRDFLQLALLMSGVAPPVQGSELSTRGTFAMHANGGREEANNYLLDGVDNNDSDNGGYVLQPSIDAIQEFKIATNSYSAEYGKASAGQVNVITRAGSNGLHGTVYDYLRNRDLDARNFFDGTSRAEYIRNQFGAGGGGAIRKDKTFFYANFEGLRELQGQTQLGTVPTAAVRRGDLSSLGATVSDPFTGTPFPGNILPTSRISSHAAQVLALFPSPNLAGTGGNYQGSPVYTGNQNQGSGRIDHRLSRSAELTVRYTYGRRDLFEPFAENQVELPGFGDHVYDRGHNALIHYQQTLGARAANSLIFGLNRAVRQIFPQNQQVDVNKLWGVNYLPTVPRDFGYPGVSIAGFSRVGDVAALPIDRADNTYQMVDNFSLIRGAHSLKAGGEARILQLNAYIEVYSRGQINFFGALTGSAMGDMLMGFPNLGIKSTYTGPQTQRAKSWSGYFQDDWKVSRSLTLNLGVRYEYDTPSTDPTNRMATFNFKDARIEQVGTNGLSRSGTSPHRKEFAPRVGFAWSPLRHTVVRGGYGLYYDAGMFVVNSSLYFNPPFFTISVFFPSETSLITLDNPFATSNGFTPPAALSVVSPNFAPSYTQHWSLDIQREIDHVGVFTAAYAAAKGTHLPRSLDINQPQSPGSGDIATRSPYPAYSNILMTESGGNSEYQSLQASFNRRLARGVSVLAAYTFSKSIDDTSAFLPTAPDQNFPQNSHNFRLERGLSSYDIPHRATLAFFYQIPGASRWTRGFGVSGIFTAQSGQPFTPMLSSDNSNTGNSGGNFGVDRPNVVHSPSLANPSPQEWFDVTAFAVPRQYTWGNAGRNILRGPGLFTTDLAVRRSFSLGESLRLVSEVQGFDLMNRANFNLPNAFADQPATFGRIFSAKAPRQIQMSLRLQF